MPIIVHYSLITENGSFCNGCIKGKRIESAKSHDTVENALRQANCIVEKKIYQYIREKKELKVRFIE
jgi:hypothetical protein